MKKILCFALILMCLLATACGQTVESSESNPITQTIPEETTVPVATEATELTQVFNGGSEEYCVVLPVYELVKRTTIAGTYEYSNFKYNEKGQLIEKKESGLSNGIITYEYDEEGRVISETDTHAYGSDKTEYTYNELGLLENTEYSIYEYDEKGNLIKETFIHPEYPDEPLILEYIYDESDVLVQEIETWYEGRSISSQYIINKKYDSAGRLVRDIVEDVIDNDKWYNTYEYAVVSSYSISSASDPTLISATEWQSFSETTEMPSPDTCIADIHFEKREDNGTAIIYTFALPTEQENANVTYYKYQSILADVCGLALELKDDMVYITRDGKLLSLMMAGKDDLYGNFVQISFQAVAQSSDSNTGTGYPQNAPSTFSNKYGTATTKCAYPGCTQNIASSGDTNCCASHSNKCLKCGCYIDSDAMYCMSCLTESISNSNDTYDYDKGYGYSAPKEGQSFSDYIKEQDPELYDSLFG